MGKKGGLTADRALKIAGEVRYWRLQAGALFAPCDRVVHPRAAALGVARIQVEVELPGQGSRCVAYLIEARVLVPDGRLRGLDADAVERFDDAEEPLHHRVFRKILLDLLIRERIAALAQLLGGERYVPRLQRVERQLSFCEPAQFCGIA